MYSVIASPTSPDDVSMTDLNIPARTPVEPNKMLSPVCNNRSPLSSIKSTNTLRNNIDIKNELKTKRTSLHFNDNGNNEMMNAFDTISTSSSSSASSSSMGQQPLKLATVKRCSRNSDRYRIEQRNSSSTSNRSSTVQSPIDNINNNNISAQFDSSAESENGDKRNGSTSDKLCNIENGTVQTNRQKTFKFQSVDNEESDGDDINIEFNDRCNGNVSDTSIRKRDSITSKESGSTDDYFLCEKFKNTLNAKLCNAVENDAVVLIDDNVFTRRMSLELLSPHEGPLGRRYAEIAPSKNNVNCANNKW